MGKKKRNDRQEILKTVGKYLAVISVSKAISEIFGFLTILAEKLLE